MSKSFLSDDLNQSLLLPPSLHDWPPEKHLARFLVDVVETLDLSAVHTSYDAKDGRDQSAYAPAMMVRVLLYGYTTGTFSSRKIQARTFEDVAFRFLSADEHPDHGTLAEFRKRHLEALAGLFTRALQLCQKAGLVKLGHVAIDGTKLQSNASKHKAMSYGRMGEAEQKRRDEIDALLKQAEAEDAAEDEQFGEGRNGDDLPAKLARRESRLAKLQEAKRALEEESRQQAEEKKAAARPESPSAGSRKRAPARRRAGTIHRCPIRTRQRRTPRRSATSPMQRAVSCPAAARKVPSCRAITRRSPWMARRRSSWPWR